MILSNPVVRFILKACGLIEGESDSAAVFGSHRAAGDCPFVLVARDGGGRWGVFHRDFETPLASFDEMQAACDFANERAKLQADSMVLIGRRREATAHPDSSMAQGTS
jgi:hypothetical protein